MQILCLSPLSHTVKGLEILFGPTAQISPVTLGGSLRHLNPDELSPGPATKFLPPWALPLDETSREVVLNASPLVCTLEVTELSRARVPWVILVAMCGCRSTRW